MPLPFKKSIDQEKRRLRPLHRQHGEECDLGRILQGQRFRNQLTHQHRQRREHEEHGHGRGRLGGFGLQTGHTLEEGGYARCDRRLAVCAQDQARQRDPYLGYGNVAIELTGILDNGQDPGGERVAVLGQPTKPAPPGPYRGEFGCYIQRRQEDQEDDNRPGNEHAEGS